MIKVMILDDEALPRIALRNIVEKKYKVVGTAATAAEAMELAKRTLPDIILVDIVLPDTNGLDFIRELSVILPLTRYIVVSNVDTTENLKKALRLDVFDYLAKDSLSEEELLNSIDNLSKKICHERSAQNPNEITDYAGYDSCLPLDFLNGLLDGRKYDDGGVRQILDTHGISFYRESYCCVVLKEESQGQVQYSNSILNLFREILFDSGEGIVLVRPSYNYVSFFKISDSIDDNRCLDDVRDYAKRCITSVKKSFGLNFSAGISSVHKSDNGLFNAYHEAKKAYEYHFYSGTNSVNCFDDSFSGCENHEGLLEKTMDGVLSLTSPEDVFQIRESVIQIRDIAKRMGVSKERVLGIYLDMVHHAAFLLRRGGMEIGREFNEKTAALTHCETLETLNCDTLLLLSWLESFLKACAPGDELIRKLKSYIDDHISESLSLESISDEVHLSPAYLGQYFKKKTGEKLKSYITRSRIELSKKYLLEGRKTKEIAELVGFSNESYFIQCFRSMTGMTPYTYYRDSIKDNRS